MQQRQAAQTSTTTARAFYANLRGARKNGRQMITSDPRWAAIEKADRNGFCGLTCSSLTRFFDEADMWSPEGICVPLWGADGGRSMEPQLSEVIKVEAPKNGDEFRNLNQMSDCYNCDVQVPGEWRFARNRK